MFYRRRLLLALLEPLGGEASRRDFHEHAFPLTRGQLQSSYDFIPYRCGCYSPGPIGMSLGEGLRLDYSVIIRQGQLHRHSRGGGTVDGAHNLHSLATFIPGDGWGPITVYCLDEILDL